jgi:hypothetical protein
VNVLEAHALFDLVLGVFEDAAQDLAVLVDSARADRRLGVELGEVAADVGRGDRAERP